MGQPGTNGERLGGQVTAVDGAKITVQMGPSTQTFITDTATKYAAAGGQTATLADVKTGVYVMAQVTKQTDGSLLATQVVVASQPFMGPGRMGPGYRRGPGVATPVAPGTNS